MDDCVSAALAARFAGSLPVELVIEPRRFRFVQVPASFGACEGGAASPLVGDWDIWCDFHVPFEISCEDGDARTLYFPNLEDDLGFDIVWRGDDAISFPFTEVFSPSFGSTRLTDPLYYVTFRFELRR